MSTGSIKLRNLLGSSMKSRSIRTPLVDDSPVILKALSQILAREEGLTVVGSANRWVAGGSVCVGLSAGTGADGRPLVQTERCTSHEPH